jgi:hypothetical protein
MTIFADIESCLFLAVVDDVWCNCVRMKSAENECDNIKEDNMTKEKKKGNEEEPQQQEHQQLPSVRRVRFMIDHDKKKKKKKRGQSLKEKILLRSSEDNQTAPHCC